MPTPNHRSPTAHRVVAMRFSFLASILATLVLLPASTLADVKIVSPTAGQKLVGGSTVLVEWKDSGSKPLLSEFTTYTLSLCMGSNKNPVSRASRARRGWLDGVLPG